MDAIDLTFDSMPTVVENQSIDVKEGDLVMLVTDFTVINYGKANQQRIPTDFYLGILMHLKEIDKKIDYRGLEVTLGSCYRFYNIRQPTAAELNYKAEKIDKKIIYRPNPGMVPKTPDMDFLGKLHHQNPTILEDVGIKFTNLSKTPSQ